MALIGFCGAHRTGKTTLAKAFAQRNGFEYIDACVSQVLKKAGYDPSKLQTLLIKDFLEAQKLVLHHITEVAKLCAQDPDKTYVMDRTPLDALAYFRAYFNGAFFYDLKNVRGGELFHEIYAGYVNSAYDACCRYYAAILMIQPGIPIVAEEGKALADSTFIEHINMLMIGDLDTLCAVYESNAPLCDLMPRETIDLNERLFMADVLWGKALIMGVQDHLSCSKIDS